MTGGDYEFVDSRLSRIPVDRDRRRVARTRAQARRCCIRALPTRTAARTVMAALDLWPRDERDRP